MITGIVSADLGAMIQLKLVGFANVEQNIEALIDTGFTGELTLPSVTIDELGLTWLTQAQAVMANGQIDTFDVYAVSIMWNGELRDVMAEEADTEPLVGMSLLSGHRLTVEVTDTGLVTVEPM